jgi:uridine phosphorylase
MSSRRRPGRSVWPARGSEYPDVERGGSDQLCGAAGLSARDHDAPSVFTAANMLREARRQRGLAKLPVPEVCLLDPDGDVVRHLAPAGTGHRHPGWACFHSELWVTRHRGRELGIVGCAVGAPYAVLVAEQLAASGCRLLVSVTSAGVVTPLADPPYFVLIERAWRDEGTSGHYLPPGEWARLDPRLSTMLDGAFDHLDEPIHRGASWTTDAPFRETAAALASAAAAGVHAVEMEAAGLYAYAEATNRPVVCVAHVTNAMAVNGDDFEKGAANGTHRILAVTAAIADRLHGSTRGNAPAQAAAPPAGTTRTPRTPADNRRP